MKTRTFLALTLIGLATLSGCAHNEESARTVPPPEVTDAIFRVGQNDVVQIKGEYFKVQSNNKSDVVASLNGRNWIPAKKIIESSPTEYVVVLPYGPDFPQVWVRVYGMNEKFSDPYLVHVQRR